MFRVHPIDCDCYACAQEHAVALRPKLLAALATETRKREAAERDIHRLLDIERMWTDACATARAHCPVALGRDHIQDGIPRLAERARTAEQRVAELEAQCAAMREVVKDLPKCNYAIDSDVDICCRPATWSAGHSHSCDEHHDEEDEDEKELDYAAALRALDEVPRG
jgi:hypothetical protein